MVAVGHVLRYTPFYSKIKEVIESGQIGDVVSVQGLENVKYWAPGSQLCEGQLARLCGDEPDDSCKMLP